MILVNCCVSLRAIDWWSQDINGGDRVWREMMWCVCGLNINKKSWWLVHIPRYDCYYSLPICLTQSYTEVFGVSTSEFQTHVPLAQEISISDYLDLIELAEDHETGISWYMGKLPLHTDVPEMFEDICNAPNSPWRNLGEVVFKRCYIIYSQINMYI